MIVILTEAFGNHANRLWQDANLRAYCHERSWTFFNPTLQNIWQNPSLGNRIKGLVGILAYRVLRKLAHWGWITVEELGPGFLPDKNRPRNVRFVRGWAFRDELAIQRHRETILGHSKIRPAQLRWAKEARLRWGTNIEHLVGVHLRRGDYRDWEGGKYFYSNDVYLKKLLELALLLGGRTGFILFSNEPVDLDFFRTDLPEVFFSTGNWQEDLLLMAACDYLVGPPSTFTMWASFMGNVPTAHIRNPDQCLKRSDFQIFPQVGQ